MKKLHLKLESKGNRRAAVEFTAPQELLLSGFKFSYVSPEALDDELYGLLSRNQRFAMASKNGCFEEGLMNLHHPALTVETEKRRLFAEWGK